MPPDVLQDVFRAQFFADTTQLLDNNRNEQSTRLVNRGHNKPFVASFSPNCWYKPAWADSQFASTNAGLRTTCEAGSSSVEGSRGFAATRDHLNVERCKKLLEDGPTSDAVEALDRLVQRGCHVPSSLFYCAVKKCIQEKNLILGRLVHALTVKSGYEGDAFLATHLIVLYASQGKLDEAMAVFSKVATPDVYNWATIISAYARHGEATEAAEAIRLYRRMRKSTNIKPDNRLYSAVLKACAAAKDIDAGRMVHAHILAGPGKPDRFVRTGLVNMYAKCGSVDDARRLFDELPDRDVVAWTTIITGHVPVQVSKRLTKASSCMQS